MRDTRGNWTSQTLGIFQRYLSAYTTALKDQPFSTSYIDAFASADYYAEDDGGLPLFAGFPDLAAPDPKAWLAGTPLSALTADPSFDAYLFIEHTSRRVRSLEKLRAKFPYHNIQIRRVEANRELRRICHLNWQRRRGVLFVDAYATQLEWDTIVVVRQTRAIDLWLLFPLGIGVERLATRPVGLPPNWRGHLDLLLGSDEWSNESTKGGQHAEELVTLLGRYFTKRLKTIFSHVSPSPGMIRSEAGNPLYLLCFASARQGTAGRRGVELANGLLRRLAH